MRRLSSREGWRGGSAWAMAGGSGAGVEIVVSVAIGPWPLIAPVEWVGARFGAGSWHFGQT